MGSSLTPEKRSSKAAIEVSTVLILPEILTPRKDCQLPTPLSRLSVVVPEVEMHEEETPVHRISPRAIDTGSDFQQLMKFKAYKPGRRLAPLNVAMTPLPEISMTPLLNEVAE